MTLYTHVAAGILGAAVAFGGAWQVQNWRYGDKIATMKQDAAEATTKAVKAAMEKTLADQQRKDDALKEATIRAHKNAAAAASANRTANSLRDELATARAGLFSSTCETARNYAAAVSELFGVCTARYIELAEKATGHASDVRTLDQAWPNP